MVGCSLCNLCSKSLNLAANLILPSGVGAVWGIWGEKREQGGELLDDGGLPVDEGFHLGVVSIGVVRV